MIHWNASVATFAVLGFVAPAAAQNYSIGTNPQGTSAYAVGAAIAKVASSDAGLRMRVVPQGGPVVTLPLVNQGRLKFSVSVSVVTSFAYNGKAMFNKRPQKKLRVVAVLRGLALGMFVRKESTYQTISDLKGKRLPSGFQKQKIAGLSQAAILASGGLTMKDVKGNPVPSSKRGVEDFMTGKVDSAMIAVASGVARQAHASIGMRALSLDHSPTAVAAARRVLPGIVISQIMPGPRHPGVLKPTYVLVMPIVLNSSEDVPAEVVYRLVKALHGNKKALVASFKGMEGFRPDQMYLDLGLSFHSGALRYYREIGQVK